MVLALIYKKVDLNKYFDVFSRKLIRFAIKEIKNAEDVLMLIQDLKDPEYFSNYNYKPTDLTTEESKSEFNKAILASRVR